MMYTLASFKDGKVTALVTFDAVSTLDEKWSANVTTQVVERGFNISDSVTVEPPTYSLKGLVTSYSIFEDGGELTWQDGQFLQSNPNTNPKHVVTRDQLITLIARGSIVTLLESKDIFVDSNMDVAYRETSVSKTREIGDCVITSLSISNPESSYDAYDISIELQKVILATVGVEELAPDEVVPTLTQYYSPKTQSGSGGSNKSSNVDDVGVENATVEESYDVSDEPDPAKPESAAKRKAYEEHLNRIRPHQWEISEIEAWLNFVRVKKRLPEDDEFVGGPFAIR